MRPILKQNIDVRERLYEAIIDYLKDTTKLPITANDFFTAVVTRVVVAPIPKEYVDLMRKLVPREELPKDAGESMDNWAASLPPGASRAFLSISPEDVTPDNLKIIDMRFQTINRVFDAAFTAFYEAASKKPPSGKEFDVFMDRMTEKLGFGSPGPGGKLGA